MIVNLLLSSHRTSNLKRTLNGHVRSRIPLRGNITEQSILTLSIVNRRRKTRVMLDDTLMIDILSISN